MHALKSYPSYTYEDYAQWEGNWELIDGLPYAMSPQATPRHQQINAELTTLFSNSIKISKCRECKVYIPLDYKIKENTIVQPDLSIICKPIKKKFLDFAPMLVIEILSESTKGKDRFVKLPLYQEAGIKWYLIVDIEKEKIEIYKNEAQEYSLVKVVHDGQFPFDFDDKCKINVDFSDLW